MNANLKKFKVTKCVGIGSYSDVFEVIACDNAGANESYALKRFNLRNSKAADCALREHRILKRLSMENSQSPFLTALFFSIFSHGFPMLFLTYASGFDLQDVLDSWHYLRVPEVVFYCSEVICGLEHLHSLSIVHLDIKPRNILLAKSGHVIITDFDCAFELTLCCGSPKEEDFRGTELFKAPEIKYRRSISIKADIWSLGQTMWLMTVGKIRRYITDRKSDAVTYRWIKEDDKHVPRVLEPFFIACLAFDESERATLEEIKRLEIFSGLNWDAAALLRRKPPFQPSKLRHNTGITDCIEDSFTQDDFYITVNAQPVQWKSFTSELQLPPECKCPTDKIYEIGSNFNFINSSVILKTEGESKVEEACPTA